MNRKLTLGIALVTLFVLLGTQAGLTRRQAGMEMDIKRSVLTSIRSTILASGKLAYKEQVELRSEVLGRVVEVSVEESQHVSKGDIVLRINPTRYMKEVEQYQAAVTQRKIAVQRQKLVVEQLQRKLERRQDLFKRNLVGEEAYDGILMDLKFSQLDLLDKKAALVQMQAQLEQAKENLEKTVIRAPIKGIVIQVDVKVGESVISSAANIPGSVLMSIADPSEVLTEVHVDEADIGKIALGQEADIYVVAFPNKPFRGKVKSIATTATSWERKQGLGFTVKILLDDLERRLLRPGIGCRAEIYYTSSEETLTVPIGAVMFDDEKPDGQARGESSELLGYIFVDRNGIAEKRVVVLGISNDTEQEIIDGLEPRERVIVGPYRHLRHLKDGESILQREVKTLAKS
ncbi:efflux RND transporter periplasmic adaptor subunit [uncultured Microbulbifer sp.]|uniref:efflux RND transporter periplasmic adaptor subunit n=1 Tax=uncultured Microbulbifer sp. TaxID=348147 RepID=UPI00261946AD|nr:efflux RND transporter periplasmic adaptor subunit [uncultured Microbulbifer sp.]